MNYISPQRRLVESNKDELQEIRKGLEQHYQRELT